jgi:anti-sigma B factor antagonist
MEIKTKNEQSAVVVSIKGRVDTVTASELERCLSELIDRGENLLILNMTDLDYISSAGLRVVLSAAKKLKVKQGDILLTGLLGVVKEVFEISGFSTIFKIFDTEEDALKQE